MKKFFVLLLTFFQLRPFNLYFIYTLGRLDDGLNTVKVTIISFGKLNVDNFGNFIRVCFRANLGFGLVFELKALDNVGP